MPEFDRAHYHHMDGQDRPCLTLPHCPSVCDCPTDAECWVTPCDSR